MPKFGQGRCVPVQILVPEFSADWFSVGQNQNRSSLSNFKRLKFPEIARSPRDRDRAINSDSEELEEDSQELQENGPSGGCFLMSEVSL